MFTITSLAGLRALAINVASSSSYLIKSTFSPFNSFKIFAIRIPFSPIHVPIASILLTVL